ncbi:MAG: preprotein translocase subunit SecY [Clostridia bacterium]|nr:preprotein translocase subunit SecY [Clostridia bacterium]
MFQTLKNAWKVVDIKNKLLFTLLIVVLYRLGANIPVPYVNAELFKAYAEETFRHGILQYLNVMSGDALSKATLFALGVSPYITSSIVIQLLTVAFPKLQEWSKDGENGRKKINFLTRIVTVALALVTSIGYVYFLESGGGQGVSWIVGELNFFKGAVIVACYCAGASIVMWLGEKINDKGIGNGISMILFANIITSSFSTFSNLKELILPTGGKFNWVGLVIAIVVVLVLLGFILLIVAVTDAERRIPVQYAKRVVGRKMYGGQSTNLPIKVNMSGVMPIIFANSIVAIPSTIITFAGADVTKGVAKFFNDWFNYNTIPYLVVFFALLIAFAYFYVAISFNPIEVANNIKQNGGSILGIRPGRPTVDYITKILYRITLVGALFVAIIAVLPMLAVVVEHLVSPNTQYFAAFAFGGSSLMIVVGVILETVRDLEAQLTLRNYKGFLD